MKKVILILAILFISINIQSQIELSVKAGVGFNNILRLRLGSARTGLINFTPLLSYQAGISTSISLYSKWKLASDALFMHKPSKVNWLGSTPSYNISFQYLMIPIYMQYWTNKKTALNFGIVNNFLLDYKLKNHDYIDKNDYNLGILLGIDYKVSKKAKISLVFQTDIKPFANELIEREFEEDTDYSYYHYNLMLSVSYLLFSTKKEKN